MVSLETGQRRSRRRKKKRCGGVGGDTDNQIPPSSFSCPLWVMMKRRGGPAPGPCCQASLQDETQRGSAALCRPAAPTWTLLGPAARVFTTNQTPSHPPQTWPRTHTNLHLCWLERSRKHKQHLDISLDSFDGDDAQLGPPAVLGVVKEEGVPAFSTGLLPPQNER